MKLRSDFVTNSSSSSFVLGFKNEESIHDECIDAFKEYSPELLGILLQDVDTNKHQTKEQIIKAMKEDLWWSAQFELWLRNNYADPDDKDVDMLVEEWLKDITQRMDGKSVFIEVTYGDHDYVGAELEHEVVPNLPITIHRISNH